MHTNLAISTLATLLAACPPVFSCESDAAPIFGCEAAKGKKFIDLCATSETTSEPGYLQYRFGSLDGLGQEKAVELKFPQNRKGSFNKFFGATYTYKGIYTQSIRFLSGSYSYTVFTRAKGSRLLGSGVDVRNKATGKTLTVECDSPPKFYIFELKGLVACDPETPIGNACIQ